MRYVQYTLVVLAISFVSSLAACALGPNDSPASEELALPSGAEAQSTPQGGPIESGLDLAVATAALMGDKADEPSNLASCPPPGSWATHCPFWSCSGTVLCAQCRKRNGQLAEGVTCINVASCGAVNNCNGHVQCSGSC